MQANAPIRSRLPDRLVHVTAPTRIDRSARRHQQHQASHTQSQTRVNATTHPSLAQVSYPVSRLCVMRNDSVTIDCDTCVMQHTPAFDDCVVTYLCER